MIYDFINWLQGKKTYLLSVAAILYAVSGWYIGQFDQHTMINMMWAALATMTLRAGISK